MSTFRRRRLSVAGLAAIVVAGAAAFTSAQQTRDRGAQTPIPTGTSSVAGRVMTADATPAPLSRVIVTLTGDELPGGRTVITDGDGRFAFERLPAGRFTIAGTKPAYLPGGYGITRPGRPAIPLQLRAGEARKDISFSLAHGAAITGTVRDANNDPAPGLNVAALRLPAPGAPPILVMTTWATTDDRGVFRIYGLAPGDYLVSSMMKPGERLSDVTSLSTAQVDDALLALQRRTPSTPTQAAAPGSPTTGNYAFTPVFFPGTPAPDEATKVTLAVGEERANVDFIVRLTRMSTITGEVIDNGHPIRPLIINPTGFELPSLTGSAPTYSSQVTQTGRLFKFTNVVPGRYVITAESTEAGTAWARTVIDVTGQDVNGVALVMQPALKLSGRVLFEGTSIGPPDPTAVTITVASPRGNGTSTIGTTRMGNARIPPALVAADGQYEIWGVMPGPDPLTATMPGQPGWFLRSAMVGGVDVLDRMLDVGTTDVTDVVVTFTDRQTTLSGTIVTAANEPAPAYFIAVFPTDRSMWRPLARRIQSARAGSDGSWIVRGLPAGEYFVAALSDVSAADLADPAFLDVLAAAAVKVTLAEGEQKTQPLRISGR